MIEIKNLWKSFGDLTILKGVDLTIGNGEVVSIIGPSGTGKSTLLRCVNCLEQASQGEITIDDRQIDLGNISRADKLFLRRNTAMVFQGFYLFNNKTVLENITEALIIVQKMTKKEAIRRAESILTKVGLADKRDAYPNQLSGGQQQRVAIGRALAVEPKILLFDEPTSALDPELKNDVLRLIRALANENKTMLIVTHEINFAKNVSDRIYFMADGNFIEGGPAAEVIDHPRHERTQQFLHHMTHAEDS